MQRQSSSAVAIMSGFIFVVLFFLLLFGYYQDAAAATVRAGVSQDYGGHQRKPLPPQQRKPFIPPLGVLPFLSMAVITDDTPPSDKIAPTNMRLAA